jgi:hypothetical protein
MPVALILFLFTLTQPYYILTGLVVMGPYRLLLLILTIPLLVGWLRGSYGRILLPDLLLLGFVLWVPVSLIANGQVGRAGVYSASNFLDTFSAYLLGRAAVRNVEDFFFFTKAFLILLLCLLPFAILESTLGLMIIQNIFRDVPNLLVFKDVTLNHGYRMGLMRAMTSFQHPILFGVLASAGISLGLVGLKYAGKGPRGTRTSTGLLGRFALSVGSLGCTFLSLSSGALASGLVQFALIAWNRVLTSVHKRWHLLIGLFGTFYVITALVHPRPPLLVLARVVSYKPSTAWNRYLIWQFGSDEVMRNPIFGMGLFDNWIRQRWMPASVDNYWLLMAMRFGLPGFALLASTWAVLIWRMTRRDFSNSPVLQEIRRAYIFSFMGLFAAMATVSVWNVALSAIFLLAGSSVWLLYVDAGETVTDTDTTAARRPSARGRPAAGDRAGSAPHARPQTRPQTAGTEPPNSTVRYTRFPSGPGKG